MPDGGEGDSGVKGGSGGKGVNRFAPYEYGKGKGVGKGKGKDKGKEKGKSKGAGKGGPNSAEGQVRTRAPALRAIAPATASAAAPLRAASRTWHRNRTPCCAHCCGPERPFSRLSAAVPAHRLHSRAIHSRRELCWLPGAQMAGSPAGPALVTSYIKQAWTVDALFQTCSAHGSGFNHIHLSACWNKLGHLVRDAELHWYEEHAGELEALVERTRRTVSTSTQIRARELANIAHGVAKSGRGGALGALMAALATPLTSRAAECNTQELANVAWAFAKAGHPDPTLFAALARAAEGHLGAFNAQELANTAWGFATIGHADAPLFASLARVAEERLADFSPQGLANTAWAFATAGHLDARLFSSVATMARQRLDGFNAQDLAHTAWAFAKLGQFDASLFMALARATERHLESFSAQGLANTAWAFAKAGQLDAQLFSALAHSIERHLADFNSQDLANTVWAFAKACHVDARFFGALASSSVRCLDTFNAQDLVNTAWGFAKVGLLHEQLFSAVAQRFAEGRCLDELNAQQISNVAWAFAKADQSDARLFTALARSAEERAADFGAPDLASVAWAFANAGQLDARLFAALATAAEGFLDEFNEEELDNTEWAFDRAGQRAVVKQLRLRRKRATGVAAAPAGPSVDVSGCGRIVVAGGGIGGAAAAVALQRKGFEVIVLEADSGFDARKQGYGLTIQGHGATQAMGISLAQDDAPSTSHYSFDAHGHILGFYGEAFGSKSKGRQESKDSGRFIHIPRQMLRSRILDEVRPGTIRWGSKLKSYACWRDGAEPKPKKPNPHRDGDATRGGARGGAQGGRSGVTVTLTDGTTLDAALLVGSDGIFSTVRRQLELPGDRLNYVGLVVVLGIVEGVSIPLAERRIFETVDGTTRIYAMPFTTSSTMWQLSFPRAEEEARRLCKDPVALKDEILARCAEWHDPIPDMLRRTPLEGMSGYPVYDREVLQPEVL